MVINSYIWLIKIWHYFFHIKCLKIRFCFSGKTDTPPVECSSRNSFIEPITQSADADSITSDYTGNKPNSTIDLKVEIHRKNSSESSEEAVQLNKPTVTTVNVQEAELVSEQDHELNFRDKQHGTFNNIYIFPVLFSFPWLYEFLIFYSMQKISIEKIQ